jgi:hypothetical protein
LLRGDAQGAQARVKKALDYVFGTRRKELDTFRPTQLETRDFVDYLLSAINQENKALSPDRKAALSRVLAYNEAPGKPYFPGIDPHVFAFQLALRIREPSLLNQKDVGICGENSLMIFFAKKSPCEFAEYAISLMRTGSGKFHGLVVEPSAETFWGASIWDLNKEKLAAADFVTVASLAPSVFGKIKEGTTPEQVCALLAKAGFANPQDKINQDEAFSGSAQSALNLNDAAAAVRAGKIVILGVHAEWVEVVRSLKAVYARMWRQVELQRGSGKNWAQGPITGEPFVTKRKPGPRERRHWILVTYLEPTPTHVAIKLYSWQNPLHAEFKLDTFLSYYEGYVAADPPADERGYLGDSDELF